jgi:hypothetical protein
MQPPCESDNEVMAFSRRKKLEKNWSGRTSLSASSLAAASLKTTMNFILVGETYAYTRRPPSSSKHPRKQSGRSVGPALYPAATAFSFFWQQETGSLYEKGSCAGVSLQGIDITSALCTICRRGRNNDLNRKKRGKAHPFPQERPARCGAATARQAPARCRRRLLPKRYSRTGEYSIAVFEEWRVQRGQFWGACCKTLRKESGRRLVLTLCPTTATALIMMPFSIESCNA